MVFVDVVQYIFVGCLKHCDNYYVSALTLAWATGRASCL